MEKIKILDMLVESKGYDTALITTFNFDPDFFEKAILSRCIRNNIKRVSVFIDSRELAKAISYSHSTMLGKKYAVNPVVMHGSFHPKVILLLGGHKARLIVTSANLTLSGYYVNNEVFNCIDYDPKHQECRDVFFDVISFFINLYKDSRHTYQLDDRLFNVVQKYPYYRAGIRNGKIWFLHNLQSSILEQTIRIISEAVLELHIAVPYYDNELHALGLLMEACPDSMVHLYLQQKKSTFPEDRFPEDNIPVQIHVFNEIQVSEKKNSRFYHGKVFLFKTATASYILYGSSNCTQSALSRTIKDGNVECDILIRGSTSEFDSYLKGFEISEDAPVDSHRMVIEPDTLNNYYFMYGTVEESIMLHIGSHERKKSLGFYFNGESLKWEYYKGHIVVSLETEEASSFSILAEYTDGEEFIPCWYNDNRMLELFRSEIPDDDRLVDKENFATGDKFRPEIEKYLQAELTCVDDIDEWDRVRMAVTKPTDELTTDVADPGDEDFIVDVSIPDEDFLAYQKYSVVEHIRGRIRTRYISSLRIPAYYCGKNLKPSGADSPGGNKPVRGRKATSEEKRFERFVKRKVNAILNEGYVSRINPDHYYGLITVVFEIIEMNREDQDLVEDIFPDIYVIDTRIRLLTALINKHDTQKLDEKFLNLCFNTLLDNHSRAEQIEEQNIRNECEIKNGSLLKLIEEKYALRSGYEEYLIALEGDVFTKESQIKYRNAKQYIEYLYGYKGIGQIREYLHDLYGQDATIEITRKLVKVVIYTDKPNNFFRPDDKLVREIVKYSINVRKISTLVIVINDTGRNSISRIRHSLNLDYFKLSTSITRRDGSVQDYPSIHYKF